MSDSGTKARFYRAVKDAHMAQVIKVDLKAELFSYSIDEDKKRYLKLLDGKLLLVTNIIKAAKRSESPTTLLEHLKRIHQQTAVTAEGKTLTGLSEITSLQKSLFEVLDLTAPTPSDLEKPAL